jgi:hypothetical protein
MKTLLPVFTAVLALLIATGLDAGEITIYKDIEGVINLTDRPAPADARIQHVISYKKKSAAELEQQRTLDVGKRQAAAKREEARKTRELKEKANRARVEAEKESALASEKIKAAEAYLERYKQKRRSHRRRYRKTAQRVAQEAREAQARANAAISRANQAREEAQKVNADQAGKTN